MSVYRGFSFTGCYCHLCDKLPATNLRETKEQMIYFSSVLWLERDDSWASFCGGSLQKVLFLFQRFQKPGEFELRAPSPSPQFLATHNLFLNPHFNVYTIYKAATSWGSFDCSETFGGAIGEPLKCSVSHASQGFVLSFSFSPLEFCLPYYFRPHFVSQPVVSL